MFGFVFGYEDEPLLDFWLDAELEYVDDARHDDGRVVDEDVLDEGGDDDLSVVTCVGEVLQDVLVPLCGGHREPVEVDVDADLVVSVVGDGVQDGLDQAVGDALEVGVVEVQLHEGVVEVEVSARDREEGGLDGVVHADLLGDASGAHLLLVLLEDRVFLLGRVEAVLERVHLLLEHVGGAPTVVVVTAHVLLK